MSSSEFAVIAKYADGFNWMNHYVAAPFIFRSAAKLLSHSCSVSLSGVNSLSKLYVIDKPHLPKDCRRISSACNCFDIVNFETVTF